MGQSISQVYLHIVFSTKHRKPMIHQPYELNLHKYITTLSLDFESPVIAIDGYVDHIHMLTRLSQKIALSEYLQKIKSNSSRIMKTLDSSLSNFAWQDGYASMSISQSHVDRVKNYINNQKDHHSKIDYREEMERLLKEHKIEYDDRYFWD